MHDIRSILKAESWNYSIFYKVRLLSPIKYPVQAVKTFIKLVKTRPSVVIVQNPPIFAALTCLIYGRFYKVKIVIDHHSIWSMGGFIKNPVVKSFLNSVERFCVRGADLNTTYADDWEYGLTRMGAEKALTIYDFVDEKWSKDADLFVMKKFSKDKKIVVMPCGGHVLERPDLLIEACKDLSATIVITGEKKYLQKHIARTRELNAENVVFTGFLPDQQYRGLIAACDFAANISEQPYGIPHVLTEALASKRPIVIGKNPAVEKLLGKDCPFLISDNNVNTIRRVFLSAFENQREYEKLATKLYKDLKKRREEQLEKLFKYIEGD
jgi:glycosyltransferase involved in cell wall biosynthesis